MCSSSEHLVAFAYIWEVFSVGIVIMHVLMRLKSQPDIPASVFIFL